MDLSSRGGFIFSVTSKQIGKNTLKKKTGKQTKSTRQISWQTSILVPSKQKQFPHFFRCFLAGDVVGCLSFPRLVSSADFCTDMEEQIAIISSLCYKRTSVYEQDKIAYLFSWSLPLSPFVFPFADILEQTWFSFSNRQQNNHILLHFRSGN